MSITQTVEIPVNHRLTIDVPPEVPAGQSKIYIFPISAGNEIISVHEADNPLLKTTVADASNRAIPVFGCLKGQIQMSNDFDEPLEDFKEYM